MRAGRHHAAQGGKWIDGGAGAGYTGSQGVGDEQALRRELMRRIARAMARGRADARCAANRGAE